MQFRFLHRRNLPVICEVFLTVYTAEMISLCLGPIKSHTKSSIRTFKTNNAASHCATPNALKILIDHVFVNKAVISILEDFHLVRRSDESTSSTYNSQYQNPY